MTRSVPRTMQLAVTIIAATLGLSALAQAGPPLICHAIQIGQARSLPWTGEGWSGAGNYDVKNLAADTLALLGPDTPVLVRMETLRRATIYARKDPQAAKQLLTRLYNRATAAESAGQPEALAWFDAGYLVECYREWIGKDLPHMTDGLRLTRTQPPVSMAMRGWRRPSASRVRTHRWSSRQRSSPSKVRRETTGSTCNRQWRAQRAIRCWLRIYRAVLAETTARPWPSCWKGRPGRELSLHEAEHAARLWPRCVLRQSRRLIVLWVRREYSP